MTFARYMNNKVKILLADDDKEDQLILTDSFNEIGQAEAIQFVDDGELLLEYLKGIDKESLPSLIVLDLNMPRMSGTETLVALKSSEEYKHIPVIIYSTSVNDHEMNKCLETGAEAYITKPVKYEDSIKTAQYFYDYCQGKNVTLNNGSITVRL